MVSVIVATKDRPFQLQQCLRSIVQNTPKNSEIIIVDQSTKANAPINRKTIRRYKQINICYILDNGFGLSRAHNIALAHARGDYVLFTDDDCIVDPGWIDEIITTFKTSPTIACITGNTYPYRNIPTWACPPTIMTKRQFFSTPTYHTHIGFGNNIAIRTSVLKLVGLFKTWLGPGSIGANCGDGEIILRILTHGYKILHNPNMIVYHNKKLSRLMLKKQNLSYVCGETACYGYFYFQGHAFAKPVILNNIRDSYFKTQKLLKKILFLQWNKNLMHDMYDTCVEIVYRSRGLLAGLIFSWTDPIH